MAGFKFLAGDWGEVWGVQLVGTRLTIPNREHIFSPIKVELKGAIQTVEVQTEETLRNKGAALGLAVTGVVLLGPLGILAGALAGKKTNVCFTCQPKDGRKFLAVADLKVFQVFQKLQFMAG